MKSMTSSKTLQQAIADITIWRKGEQRTPHKLLLLLHVLAGYGSDGIGLANLISEAWLSALQLSHILNTEHWCISRIIHGIT